MSEHSESGGGNEFAFFIFFAVILILAWMFIGSRDGTFSLLPAQNGTSTTPAVKMGGDSLSSPRAGTPVENTPQTRRDIENKLSGIKTKLDGLKADAREAAIWGTHSPLEGKIMIDGIYGTAGDDENREYVLLRAASGNKELIPITGMTLESVVTDERVEIPYGTKVAYPGRVNKKAPIMLEPSEAAYVVTGDSPIGASFHDNMCVGYLRQHQSFYPSLNGSCPSPQKEMEEFGNIELDDDSCYSYISRVQWCTEPTDDLDSVEPALSSDCIDFIRDNLSYEGCVRNHRDDPFFGRGMWHVYLEESSPLWRHEREIVRLLDTEGRTIDVYEF